MASQVRFRIEGILELEQALMKLPPALVGEARGILEDRAEITKYQMFAAYARGKTGNLREGLTIEYQHTSVSSRAIIRNKAKHAYIYETGTEARHTLGKKGMPAGIPRGSMPAGKVFIPRMIAARRAFWKSIRELLERNGLIVTGEAA